MDYPDIGVKPAVVVSNNSRNNVLPSVLAVRITSAPKPDLESIVRLPAGEPLVGRVLCDTIGEVHKDQLVRNVGGLSMSTMLRVNYGLRTALALYPK